MHGTQQLLDRLLETMRLRGPDDEGRFVDEHIVMGMRRLAVIDPEHGRQPLTNCAGTIVAFQNGEIYNHMELRRELEDGGSVFRTRSDTEVLVHGYEQWGIEGLLRRLDGMFAVALLDRNSGDLHLARDRFGEKPLYYSGDDEWFSYSSNMTALALLDWVDIDIDHRSLDRYLALHYVPGRRTMLNGIRRVLPGERLTLHLATMEFYTNRYYSVNLSPVVDTDAAELRDRIESAVASRLLADVPVGVLLSGGLDSALVATFAAKHHPGINTFSMGFQDPRCDESPHAKAVAKHIGSTHHHFVFDERAFLELLPAVVESLDDPVGDQALLPTYWLCREARKHVTVVLSGEGADELFGGYSYYQRFAGSQRWVQRLQTWIRRSSEPGRETTLCRNALPVTPSGFPIVMDAASRERLIGVVSDKYDAWEHELFETLDRSSDALQRATTADLLTWLPDDLLIKLDRMAMAHSLEARAPFLAQSIAEMAIKLPAQRKISRRQSKVALRGVAESVLPPEIVRRPKHGFIVPMTQWIAQWFREVGPLRRYLDLSRVRGLDADALARLLEQEIAGGCQNERLLFALIMLVEWHRVFYARVTAHQRDATCA
jgi:asparagine synthase (glutamine-hydrolysing)